MILRKLQTIESDCSESVDNDTVHRFMGADGQYRWFHTSVALTAIHRKDLAFHGIMLDTTAQKAAEHAPPTI
jgi:hypothetical protein